MNRETEKIIAAAESALTEAFARIDRIALINQEKVLNAFRTHSVGLRHFAGTNGYGYDDQGRDTLGKLFADVFHTERAIVSPLLVSGTHALSAALFGILRPGDEMLAVSGAPYDTLQDVIGGQGNGSLRDFGVTYAQAELKDGRFDYEAIAAGITPRTKLIFAARSHGYEWREALSVREIGELCAYVKAVKPDLIVLCDNCYGEFVEEREPTDVGADLVAGSLIKNIGGGIAPTGGYVCGRADLVELICSRLTAPSIGTEVGSYAYGYKDFFQGLFMAPHVTANALKGSLLFGKVFDDLGFETMPAAGRPCGDIIRSVKLNSEERLTAFCRAIQEISPIDSNVVPFAWDMPGYEDRVIMAAGTFVAGASIELSADSPIRPPYIAYLQGGLTYEHCKLALAHCLERLTLI